METKEGHDVRVDELIKSEERQEFKHPLTYSRKRKYETLDGDINDDAKVKDTELETADSFCLLHNLGEHNLPFSVLVDICGHALIASLASVSKKMLSVVQSHLNGLYLLDDEQNPRMSAFVPASLRLSQDSLLKRVSGGLTNIYMIIGQNYDPYDETSKFCYRVRTLKYLHLIKNLHLYAITRHRDNEVIPYLISQTTDKLVKVMLRGCIVPRMMNDINWSDTKETLVIHGALKGVYRIPPVRNLRVTCINSITLDLPDTVTCLSLETQYIRDGEIIPSYSMSNSIDVVFPSRLKYLQIDQYGVGENFDRGIPDSLTHLHVPFVLRVMHESLKNSNITHLFVNFINENDIRFFPTSIRVLSVGYIQPSNTTVSINRQLVHNKQCDRIFLKNPTYCFNLYQCTDPESERRREINIVSASADPTKFDLSHLVNLEELVVPGTCTHLKLGSKLKILIWSSGGFLSERSAERFTLECDHQPEKIVSTRCAWFNNLTVTNGPITSEKYVLNNGCCEQPLRCVEKYDIIHHVTA